MGSRRCTGDLRDPESLEQGGGGMRRGLSRRRGLPAVDARSGGDVPVERRRDAESAGSGADVMEWRRVVYTSTVGCIGIPKDGIGDEQTPVGIEDMQGPYKRSKFLAEQVALEFAAGGFPVVIVNPTAPVGDHDFKPTPTGKMVVDFVRGRCRRFSIPG